MYEETRRKVAERIKLNKMWKEEASIYSTTWGEKVFFDTLETQVHMILVHIISNSALYLMQYQVSTNVAHLWQVKFHDKGKKTGQF